MIPGFLREAEYDRWDSWLAGLDHSTVKQSSLFREALALFGHRSEILLTADADGFVAGSLLSIDRPVRTLGFSVRTSGGIAMRDPSDPSQLRSFLGTLDACCRELRAHTVSVSLRVPECVGEREVAAAKDLLAVLQESGFTRTRTFGTYYVDLQTPSEEALLAGFERNTRRQIQKASRAGLTVGPTQDPEVFRAFGSAHRRMARRKGLTILPRGLASEVLLPLARAGQGSLFVASFRGDARNFAFVSALGIPVPHWAALRDSSYLPQCPGTGHALHFGAMCHYRLEGKLLYDFGGAQGPVPDKADPNYGVWRFKHGFAGTYVRFLGNFRKTLRPLRSSLVDLGRRGRRVRDQLLRRR